MSAAVDELLRGQPAPVVELALALRELVHTTLPGIEERVQKGWGIISYFNPKLFLYIGPSARGGFVYLGFARGVELAAPEGLLTGNGKAMRHIRLHPDRDLPIAELRTLIGQAAAMAPPQQTRTRSPKSSRRAHRAPLL